MVSSALKSTRKVHDYVSKKRARRWLLHSLPPNSVGLEIGVHLGDFSQQVLDVVRPARFHLVDPWMYIADDDYKGSLYGGSKSDGQAAMDQRFGLVQERFRSEINQGIVTIHRASSEDAVNEFPDEYFDWIYIDGNHIYEFVKKDLDLYSSKVKDGGIIAGDDYGFPGWWNDGVTHAVDEFLSYGRAEMIGAKFGQFMLRKRARGSNPG